MNQRQRFGTDKFGWCLIYTEDHANCRTEYVDSNGKTRRCGCECHTATASPKKKSTRRPA